MDLYQQVIAKSRYAKYRPELDRREHWNETVQRFMDYIKDKCSDRVASCLDQQPDYVEIRQAIENLDVMPSMRLMMTAGEAVERDNISAYNCAYLAVNNHRVLSEALYILMCGVGVGFSCERQVVARLPKIPTDFKHTDNTIVVADSKRGWAKAFNKLIVHLYRGEVPNVDYSRVRPAGSILKTFGGRASGPEPLKRLFNFCVESFQRARGRKLNSLEVHDIMCTIGEIVVVGGVRRSALISLSNLSDRRLQEAKSGQWWVDNPQRGLANNSVCYTEHPDAETFIQEWAALIKSKSGERGIFNRVASQTQASKYGKRPFDREYGCNPCSEIILRDKQFCNLTEVVVRPGDNFEDLKRKVEIATILGTIQATLTNFKFISTEWIDNTEEERLLGVSLTGIMDHSILSKTASLSDIRNFIDPAAVVSPSMYPEGLFDDGGLVFILEELRNHARRTNEHWSNILGIPTSTAITCVKPSGTVSQLVNSASGIHARHAPFYIRRIRMDKKDPMYEFLKSSGVPCEDEMTRPDSTAVFSFPIAAPKDGICRDDMTAIGQLEMWLLYQRHWCEHKPSVTISVKDDEWMEVGAWVWKHFDEVSGISFLPHSDHTYQQAPYEEISEEEYMKMVDTFPADINWNDMKEGVDNTEGTQTLACTGGGCEI